MMVKLTLENAWIETGDGKGGIIRRIQTLDEYLEGNCEICLKNEGYAEVSVEDICEKEECIICCRECARSMVDALLSSPNFIGNVKIVIL